MGPWSPDGAQTATITKITSKITPGHKNYTNNCKQQQHQGTQKQQHILENKHALVPPSFLRFGAQPAGRVDSCEDDDADDADDIDADDDA